MKRTGDTRAGALQGVLQAGNEGFGRLGAARHPADTGKPGGEPEARNRWGGGDGA